MNVPVIPADIETPALLLDLNALDRNIKRMAAWCRSQNVAWRPHVKCHKCPEIAGRQLEAGAAGLTCAKLAEAEVMADAGFRDLLIANLVVGDAKLERLAGLSQTADPLVVVDAAAQAEPMSRYLAARGVAVRVLVEVDIGMERVGVAPGSTALELARRVAELPALRLAGVMGYEGHLLQVPDLEEKLRAIHASLGQLFETAEMLRDAGLPCDIVSCGGTGSFREAARAPGVTEIQAGGAVLMDEFYRQCCSVDAFENALFLATTVVSRPAPDRVVVDAGQKCWTRMLCPPRLPGWEGISVRYLSAEHGVLDVDPEGRSPAIGERLAWIPGYADFTTILHDRFLIVQDGRVVDEWRIRRD